MSAFQLIDIRPERRVSIVTMTNRVNTSLKHSMGARQFRALSAVLHAIEPAFDEPVFLATALDGLEHLTLMERVRRASDWSATTLLSARSTPTFRP